LISCQYPPIPVTNPIQFFGDSITQGFSVTPTTRWSYLLSSMMNSSELNYAVSGQEWVDGVISVYNSLNRGLTTFIPYGGNDIIHGQTQIDQVVLSIQAAIIYTTLPSQCIVNPRITSDVSGKWSNTTMYKSIGLSTSTLDGSANISSTVTGRYIVFGTTVYRGSSLDNFIAASVKIDNKEINNLMPLVNTLQRTYLGVDYTSWLYWYDTGIKGEGMKHVITVTPSLVGSLPSPSFYLDWFGGFDQQQVGSTPVLIPEFGPMSEVFWSPANPSIIDSLKHAMKKAADQFRCVMGLPVYYIPGMYDYSVYGMLTTHETDLLHPNTAGHAYVAERAAEMMNGQSSYLPDCRFIKQQYKNINTLNKSHRENNKQRQIPV